ncbi:MAG: helix-turn-helix transcriptional regulator [Clostridia bacterium]|nr:helix-turn-helix transcriptional regulator [Clostridia bacterium]
MNELKLIVAKNISMLRRQAGYTQLELAEMLNYSDKAVSKWESGLSIPDVGVLLDIARLFGVTVDYLLESEHEPPATLARDEGARVRIRTVVTLLSVALVWLLATGVFVTVKLATAWEYPWLLFVYAVPVSALLLLIFNCIWGRVRLNYLIISILMWTVLLSIFLSIAAKGLWLIFLLGVPGQIIILLWAGMKKPAKNKTTD